ncbi:unnamed protein product, partial [Chrysoparadoxa australica]
MKNFFASCPRGMEEILLKESQNIGFDYVEVTRGGINFKSSPLKAITFLFQSRVASRVYKEIGSFDFTSDKDLYKGAKEIPWPKNLNPTDTFKVDTIISREVNRNFRNSHYLSLVLKDAIADQFKEKAGKRPSIDLDSPLYPLTLRIEPHPKKKGYKVIVVLDLMGFPLNKRGYRTPGHEAPIKENLAAALLLSTDWDQKSPLIDPFCGSGTFLLEGALIRHQIAPLSLLIQRRIESDGKFLFENQKWFQKDEKLHTPLENLLKEHLAHFNNAKQTMGTAEFFGNDKDSRAIGLLMESWGNLGFPRKGLRVDTQNALSFQVDGITGGTLITNPPYGVRLEAPSDELIKLYHDFGESLKSNWTGFNAFVIAQDAEFRKAISLRTSQ